MSSSIDIAVVLHFNDKVHFLGFIDFREANYIGRKIGEAAKINNEPISGVEFARSCEIWFPAIGFMKFCKNTKVKSRYIEVIKNI